MLIKICSDFSETPGARYKKEGQFSGEEFRDKWLIPQLNKLKNSNETITIDFDGGYGYPTSFLEEAFGGLARIVGADIVLKKFQFVSNDEPDLVEEVKGYIKSAKKVGRKEK